MSHPEKTERNQVIFYLHLTGYSYRKIQKKMLLKNVKSVYTIVSRMRKRHKNVKEFIGTYEKLST